MKRFLFEIWCFVKVNVDASFYSISDALGAVCRDLIKVNVESDCKAIVDSIIQMDEGGFDSRVIVEDILHLISEFPCVNFQFIGRAGNELAHSLAKSVLLLMDSLLSFRAFVMRDFLFLSNLSFFFVNSVI